MNRGRTILPLILAALVLSSCEGFDLVGRTSVSGLGNPDEGKTFLVEALNYWVGRSKDERIRVFGTPTQCTKLNTGGEVCEWRNTRQHVAFNYDLGGVARSWSYRGEYGQFTNANHQMVKAPLASSRPPQQEMEWVHPTKAKSALTGEMMNCKGKIMSDPNNINLVRGPISGSRVLLETQMEQCMKQNGWARKEK